MKQPTKLNKQFKQKIYISQYQPLSFSCKKILKSEGPQINFQDKQRKKIDESYKRGILTMEQPEYTETNNILPINFANSVSEYNKLLITNGRKVLSSKQSIFEPQDLETLNVPIFKKNIQIREQILTNQKQKQKKQKHIQNVTNCGCCCCDKYCYLCQQEQKISQLSKRKSTSSLSFMKSRKSQRAINQLKQSNKEVFINKSQLKRQQKLSKLKKSIINIDPILQQRNKEKYQLIKPIVQHGIRVYMSQQKRRKQQKIIQKNSILIAKQQIKNFGEEIRKKNFKKIDISQNQDQNSPVKRYAWGADQQRINSFNKKNIRQQKKQNMRSNDIKISSPKKQERQNQKNRINRIHMDKKQHTTKQQIDHIQVICHPKSNLSKQKIVELKKKHLLQSLKQLKKYKQEQKKKKKLINKNLQKLQKQRKGIIQKTKKKQFRRPSKQQQQNIFVFDIESLRKKPQQLKKRSNKILF